MSDSVTINAVVAFVSFLVRHVKQRPLQSPENTLSENCMTLWTPMAGGGRGKGRSVYFPGVSAMSISTGSQRAISFQSAY